MERHRTLDNSLKERHDIIHLLKQVEREDVSFDEIDTIGRSLKLAGKRALTPLLKRLWQETDGELISRFAYLLDFFDEEPWLDQLIQVALRRTDLDSSAKSALLGALQDYGVDITTPPFANMLDDLGGPLAETLPRMLDRGEEGLIEFMEDFLQYPQEMQTAIIQEMAQIADPRVLQLLEIMLGLDSPELLKEIVTTLGKIRDSAAADVLARCAAANEQPLADLCLRSLRRLAFLDITPSASELQLPTSSQFHVSWASPLDGAGYRTLWFARWAGPGTLSFMCLHLHETTGVRAAWGSSSISVTEFDNISRDRVIEDGLVRVDISYALQLLRDALFRNRDTLFQLPPEYYVLKGIFKGEELTPTPYLPDFTEFDLNALAHSTKLLMAGARLFEDDCFAGWYMATCRVYDFAEEWIALEKKGDGKSLAKGLDAILDRYCRDLIAPIVDQIRNRLLLTADLLLKTGRERSLVETTLASAMSLGSFAMPYHLHPFIRQLALESMDAARVALDEGYDLREHPHEADDDEWLD
jgi:hypothetical protein